LNPHSQHKILTTVNLKIRSKPTGHVVAAVDLFDVHTARCGRTLLRDLLNDLYRLLFVGLLLFPGQSLSPGARILSTRLAFVEGYIAREAVACVAQLAVENVPIIFGKEGAWDLALASESTKVIRHWQYPKSKRRSGRHETLHPPAWPSWPRHRCIYLAGQQTASDGADHLSERVA